MRQSIFTSYKFLYILWAIFYIAAVVLGFMFPIAEGAVQLRLIVLSILFFLPPWVILFKSRMEENIFHRNIIRWLSAASLSGTLILLILNLRSIGMSEAAGRGLHAALTVISAPMICSNFYIIPLFLWATLLMGSLKKYKIK